MPLHRGLSARFASLLLVLPAIFASRSAWAQETPTRAERSSDDFWSISGILERDGEERTMYGVDFHHLIEMECPPFAGQYGGQILRGDGQTIVRSSATMTLFGFPMGRHVDFWFRPIVGLEYRDTEPHSGFGALTSLGGEVILKLPSGIQLALTYDRIFSTLATNTQVGLAVRWGRKLPSAIPEQPDQGP